MLRFYYLSTCTTCQRIMKELDLTSFELQDIKHEPITATQLDEMKRLAGSYESLFSRRAMKYRQWGLHEQSLSEDDYRKWICEEYTFLKRPVAIVHDQIFIGSSKKTVAALQKAVQST